MYDESDIYVDAYRDVHKLTQLLKHHDTKWRGLLKTMAQEKKNALRLIGKTTKTVKSGGKSGHKSGGTKSGSKSGSKSDTQPNHRPKSVATVQQVVHQRKGMVPSRDG